MDRRMIQKNKVIDLAQFNNRLTKWLKLHELDFAIENYLREGEETYGKVFVIKRNNKNKKYAMFIHRKNRQRRKEDKEMKDSMDDFFFNIRASKSRGISIIKLLNS